MKLAVMQPYFFPYLGYFSLIAATDHFVVFDPVQYIRHGWINRNRIFKPGFEDVQFVTVPLEKHSRDTRIRDIRIANRPWKQRIKGQLQHYKKAAPHFDDVQEIVTRCLSCQSTRMVDFNVHCLKVVCEAIGLALNLSMFETIESGVGAVEGPGDWALETAIELNADTYINPIGGRELFDATKFRANGINLLFVQAKLREYPQPAKEFVQGLSIIDVMMFNGLQDTRKLINEYETIIS